MMGKFHWFPKFLFLGFYYIPFLFELRTIIDWTFTKTSLDVYQWIKLCVIQADLYKAKCNNLFYMKKKVGTQMPLWYRYLVGYLYLILILILVLGPMFLFSSFDFIGGVNPVQQVTLSLSLNVENTPYKLFETQAIHFKVDSLNDKEYQLMQFR
jgi:hypothetical protein